MNWKIFIKPALNVLDMALDGLVEAIKSGNTEKALLCIEEVRKLIKEVKSIL